MEPLTHSPVYMSPEASPGPAARHRPSMAFHWKMLGIYWRAYRQAVAGTYDGDQWANSSLEVLRALESVGVRVRAENVGSLGKIDGPCVLVANHMSTLETFVLPCMIQPFMDTTFIVKASLVDFPVFGPVMRSRDPVTVGRRDPREDLKTVLQEGRSRLENGRSIVVFPQTTRRRVFDPEQFNTIGVKLAARAGVPVVPVALRTDAWDVGRVIKDFGPIHPERPVRFAFGEPIEVTGNGREAHQAVIDFIQEKLKKWESEASDTHSSV